MKGHMSFWWAIYQFWAMGQLGDIDPRWSYFSKKLFRFAYQAREYKSPIPLRTGWRPTGSFTYVWFMKEPTRVFFLDFRQRCWNKICHTVESCSLHRCGPLPIDVPRTLRFWTRERSQFWQPFLFWRALECNSKNLWHELKWIGTGFVSLNVGGEMVLLLLLCVCFS